MIFTTSLKDRHAFWPSDVTSRNVPYKKVHGDLCTKMPEKVLLMLMEPGKLITHQ